MKRVTYLGALIFGALVASAVVYACQPCPEVLSFKRTVEQADVILIGRRVAVGPRSGTAEMRGEHDWIDVHVIEVLKGDASDVTLRVNSWDGMCPYGIVIDEQPHVLFLVQEPQPSEEVQYDAVNNGCAVKAYAVEGETVRFEEQDVSLERFRDELHSHLK